jgi:hypothetical protein
LYIDADCVNFDTHLLCLPSPLCEVVVCRLDTEVWRLDTLDTVRVASGRLGETG